MKSDDRITLVELLEYRRDAVLASLRALKATMGNRESNFAVYREHSATHFSSGSVNVASISLGRLAVTSGNFR